MIGMVINLQIFIFKNKNKLMLINFILIITGFIFKFLFKNDLVFDILLIIASIIGLLPILFQAISSLKLKIVSIDVLVTIAVIGAFVIKNYEESAIVTFLFLFGAYLEQRTLNKTKNAIKELTDLRPTKAYKKIGNEFVLTNIYEIEKDDIVRVQTGDLIPVDGIVISGGGYVNEASITGESKQVKKSEDKLVYAGTILDNGTIIIKTNSVGEDTTFGKIIELVEDAQDSKSDTEKFINKFSTYYTPLVLLIALVVYIFTKDVSLSVTVLVLGCPGALVIGVPVSNVSGIGNGARNGVLLKGSETISDLSKTDTIIFDKTGTLTYGEPKVSSVSYYNGDKDKAIKYLYSIEKESNHPLAKAIINYYNLKESFNISNTNVINGFGINALINNDDVLVGNLKLMEKNNVLIKNEIYDEIKTLEINGNSIVLMAINKELKLLIGIKDLIRESAFNDIKRLKQMGIKNFILLSGDSQEVVDLVVKELNLTKGYGNMLPDQKANYVKDLKEKGHIVTFVGDGINDSPSIALANVGIAMGSGTDVAIETSDVVLMNSDLAHLTHAYGLSKKIVRNTIENIVIALLVVAILVTGLIFTNLVSMSVGMLVHEGSILVVILNGMRLLKYKNKGVI